MQAAKEDVSGYATSAADALGTVGGWLLQPASTNLRVLAWIFGMAALAVVFIRTGRALTNHWLTHRAVITDWIAKAPTTNLRVLVGIVLAIVFVLGTMLAFVLGYVISGEALLYVGGFILLQMGLDVAHYGVKRATFKPEALGLTRESVSPGPATPAAQIVQATGEPVPAQSATAAPALSCVLCGESINDGDRKGGNYYTVEGVTKHRACRAEVAGVVTRMGLPSATAAAPVAGALPSTVATPSPASDAPGATVEGEGG